MAESLRSAEWFAPQPPDDRVRAGPPCRALAALPGQAEGRRVSVRRPAQSPLSHQRLRRGPESRLAWQADVLIHRGILRGRRRSLFELVSCPWLRVTRLRRCWLERSRVLLSPAALPVRLLK